ncbi:MAG: hypothetical protein GC162_11350 [Planctomycetes bacterium]|nr:hypothetical protein [Planctomycetota bacterium]
MEPSPAAAGVEPANPNNASIRPIAGRLSLWGELPGSEKGANPTDASDNLRQVTFSREGSDYDVNIDPTGQWLVFASTRHRATADIYLKRVDGNTTTQLTNDPGNDVMPAFSPDGKQIAFASDRAGNWDIYVQGVDGGAPVQLTNDPSQELHPSWSPDGKQIVFSSLGTQSGQWEMVVIDVENTARRKFIGFGLFPTFSPDGKKIAFQRARFRGTRTFSVWTIDYVNGEGMHPTEIAVATNAAVISPAWSPDGKKLAFTTVVNPPSEPGAKPQFAELWMINVDGTGRTKLTNDKYANTQPVWGPSGALFFVSNRAGFDNIWSVHAGQSMMAGAEDNKATTPQASVPTE